MSYERLIRRNLFARTFEICKGMIQSWSFFPSMWTFFLATEQTHSAEGCRISLRMSPQRKGGHCGQRLICSRDKWERTHLWWRETIWNIERTPQHHDRDWKGRVDGTIDSARYRFGCLCHYEVCWKFQIYSAFSELTVREDVVYSYELINLGSFIFVKDGCDINVIRSLSQFGK